MSKKRKREASYNKITIRKIRGEKGIGPYD